MVHVSKIDSPHPTKKEKKWRFTRDNLARMVADTHSCLHSEVSEEEDRACGVEE